MVMRNMNTLKQPILFGCLWLLLIASAVVAVDNPVIGLSSIHDCDVLKYNGEYYITGNWLYGDVLVSADLENWGQRRHVFSWSNSWHTPSNPADPDADIAGSHLRYANGVFHFYTQLALNDITHAVSDSVLGPYEEVSVDAPFCPRVTGSTQQIDAEVFVDTDGRAYFYCVNKVGGENLIFGRPMSDLWTPDTEYILLLTPGGGWELTTPINEGPKVFKYRGLYYMLYNAFGNQSPNYAIGCATSSYPLGFTNSGKYPYPVITRREYQVSEETKEITQIGQPWVVDGVNGFEKWLGYFAEPLGERSQRIDRIHFFDRTLFVDGPTNQYIPGYHPGPSRPQLRALFHGPDGPFAPEDWMPIEAGDWRIQDQQLGQFSTAGLTFLCVNRDPARHYLFEANLKLDDTPGSAGKAGVLAYYEDAQNWLLFGMNRDTGRIDYHLRESGQDTTGGYPLPAQTDTGAFHCIRITRNDNRFECLIDGQYPQGYAGPLATGFNAAGRPGLYADCTAARFDGVIYTIGWDEYDEGIIGWGGAECGTSPGGTWTVGPDGLTQSAGSGQSHVFKGDFMPQYEASVQLYRQGAAGGIMGFYPVYIDSSNHVLAALDTAQNELTVTCTKAGAVVEQRQVSVSAAEAFNLRAVKLHERLILFVDGQEAADLAVSYPSSQVGLYTDNRPARFNGILVFQMEPEIVPAPWQRVNISNPYPSTLEETFHYYDGSFVLDTLGALGETSDQISFLCREITGSRDIEARLLSHDPVSSDACAGLMIRNSADADSPMAALSLNADNQLVFRVRKSAGDRAFNRKLSTAVFPRGVRLKLSRQNDIVQASYSEKGTDWTLFDWIGVDLGRDFLAGLFSCSFDSSRRCGAVFDGVSVPSGCSAAVLGDVDGDCWTDFSDVIAFAEDWLTCVPYQTWESDLDEDGCTDMRDFSVLSNILDVPGSSLRNQLLAHWTFEGLGSSSFVPDAAGSGYHAFCSKSSVPTVPGYMWGSFTAARMAAPDSAYWSIAQPSSLDPALKDMSRGCTVCVWFRLPQTGVLNYARAVSFIPNKIELTFMADGRARFIKPDDAVYSTGAFNDNRWHHFVGVYDPEGNYSAVYIDGVRQSTGDGDPCTGSFSGAGAYLANNQDLNRQFTGDLDDIKLYNYPLDPTAIEALYAAENPRRLLAHWTFDQAASDPDLEDAAGSQYHAFCSASSVSTIAGYIQNSTAAVRLAGSNTYWTVQESAVPGSAGQNLSEGCTAAVWFRLPQTGVSEYARAVSFVPDKMELTFRSDGRARFIKPDDAVYSTNTFNDGQWHHFVGVYDPASNYSAVYIDGVLEQTGDGDPFAGSFTGLNAYLANSVHLNRQFTGDLDDIKFYNYPLGQTEIETLYETEVP